MVTMTHQLFVRGAQTAVYDCLQDDNVADLKRRIEERTGVSKAHQILAVGSKILDDRAPLQKISARNATLRLSMRLRGGRDDEHPWSFMEADPLYAPAELPLDFTAGDKFAPLGFGVGDREISGFSVSSWDGDATTSHFQNLEASLPSAAPALQTADGFRGANVALDAAPVQPAASSPGCSHHGPEEDHAPASSESGTPVDSVAAVSDAADGAVALDGDHNLDSVSPPPPPPTTAHNTLGSSDVRVVKAGRGHKGLAYDLDSVDEKVKRRLIKNRLSAERSRQRKNARMSDMEDQLTHANTQLDHVRAENAELKQRLAAFEALARAHGLNHML
jgi:hypothetical protein